MLNTVQKILDDFALLRRLYSEVGARGGARVSTILGKLAAQIVSVVGAGTNAEGAALLNDPQVLRLISDMDKALQDAKRQYNQAFTELFKDGGQVTLSKTPEIYMSFGRASVRALEAARDDFVTQLRGNIYNNGFRNWIAKFPGEQLKASMQKSLMQAQLEGWDQRTLAKNFLRDPLFQFENLPAVGGRAERVFSLSGRLSTPEALVRRAHVIARTENTAVTNQMHRSWTTEAGMDLAINVNGDPVSEICQEANQQDPMTFEEWDQSEWGAPPRHPNCDSVLMAVPPGFSP